jgi:hypothetical protein
LVGDLGLGEIGCGLGGIHADESIFLGAEVDGVLIEEIFAEVELVQGVAVEDAQARRLNSPIDRSQRNFNGVFRALD